MPLTPQRLFNEYEALTADGYEIADAAHAFACEKMRSWLKAGFSGRDVESAIMSGVMSACAEEILRHATELRRQHR